ncbi:Glutathione S-transferase GST-6.0 [compost metagenome]
MKLFYTPGACSLAVHIVLREIGQPFELEKVDLKDHLTDQGEDYRQLNPKGYVPLLQMDNGQTLTEGPVIAQYLADQAGREDLMPAAGSPLRYRVMEWQSFITSELHKSFGALFNKALSNDAKAVYSDSLHQRLDWVSRQLRGRPYLTGDDFTAADAYLFVITLWAQQMRLDTSSCPELEAFKARVAARPAVQEAMKAEGLG